ncbi:ATP-dependent DNA helicase PIF1-like protein, partial [Tanacetum coccineum]
VVVRLILDLEYLLMSMRTLFALKTIGTDLAALLIKTSLIIWDKAPMMHIHCFEALDQSLRDIIGSTNPKSKRYAIWWQDVIHASLNSSYIWDDYTVLELTINMRLREGSDKSNIEEIKEFGDWILKMGDGRLSGTNDGEATIDIPDDMLISDNIDPIASLIEFVYLSSDSICESEGVDNTYTESLYSPEVLNGLKLFGISNHRLALKVGAPVMLLQNINQSTGLCNGTRLRILNLGEHVIEA